MSKILRRGQRQGQKYVGVSVRSGTETEPVTGTRTGAGTETETDTGAALLTLFIKNLVSFDNEFFILNILQVAYAYILLYNTLLTKSWHASSIFIT